jgi:hypothetical protein
MSDPESDGPPPLEEVEEGKGAEFVGDVQPEPEAPTQIDLRIRVERPKLEHVLSGKFACHLGVLPQLSFFLSGKGPWCVSSVYSDLLSKPSERAEMEGDAEEEGPALTWLWDKR